MNLNFTCVCLDYVVSSLGSIQDQYPIQERWALRKTNELKSGTHAAAPSLQRCPMGSGWKGLVLETFLVSKQGMPHGSRKLLLSLKGQNFPFSLPFSLHQPAKGKPAISSNTGSTLILLI
jgi:hypothetical protein